ncbi:MAG: lysoplasmalogenase [Oscillospiraceae bacterium]
MTLLLWVVLTLPVMISFLMLFFFSKKYSDGRWGLIAKCGGSYIAVMTAAAGGLLNGSNPLLNPLLWGLALCAVADALLEIKFPVGVIAFALAHLAFLGWFISQAPLSPMILVIFIPVMIAFTFFLPKLKKVKGNKIPYYIYPVILSAMAAVALMLPIAAGIRYLAPAIGAALFVFSDSLVIQNFLCEQVGEKPGKYGRIQGAAIMITYYAALYLLAVSAWVI